MLNEKSFSFFFFQASVTVLKPEAQKFVSPVISVIRSLLPPQHGFRIHLISGMQTVSSAPLLTQFVDLYISCCHSVKIDVDTELCLSLRHSLRKKQPLCIIQGNYNGETLRAFLRSLSLTRNIRHLIIGGESFPDLYLFLSQVLRGNPSIKSITLNNYKESAGFVYFLKSLCGSFLSTLVFDNILLSRNMVNLLVSHLIGTRIEKVDFHSCSLGIDCFKPFIDSFVSLTRILSFSVSGDKNPSMIGEIIRATNIWNLTSISLSQMKFDISEFFASLNGKSKALLEINLSKNFCSGGFNGDCIMPPRLSSLMLSEVKWHDNSLITLLTAQKFFSPIFIELNNISYDCEIKSLSQIDPTHNLYKISWNHNPLSPEIIKFFGCIPSLTHLWLDFCILDDSDGVLIEISKMLEKVPIEFFSAKQSFSNCGLRFIETISSIAQNNPTLQALLIDNNNIGDEGLKILKNIIMNNKSITSISFDGSNPKHAPSYLQFLHDIVGAPHLFTMTKPKMDMIALSENSPKRTQKDIKTLWERLEMQIQQNISDHKKSIKASELSVPTAVSSTSESPIEWDINIEIGFESPINEWDSLKSAFSLENLTGIPLSKRKEGLIEEE